MITGKKLYNQKDVLGYVCDFNDDKLSFQINNDEYDRINPSFPNSIKRTIEEESLSYSLDLDSLNIVSNSTIINREMLIKSICALAFIIEEVDKYDNLEDLIIELDIENDKEFPIEICSKDFEIKYQNKEVKKFINYTETIFINILRSGEILKLNIK